jgi:hypothetical protein
MLSRVIDGSNRSGYFIIGHLRLKDVASTVEGLRNRLYGILYRYSFHGVFYSDGLDSIGHGCDRFDRVAYRFNRSFGVTFFKDRRGFPYLSHGTVEIKWLRRGSRTTGFAHINSPDSITAVKNALRI